MPAGLSRHAIRSVATEGAGGLSAMRSAFQSRHGSPNACLIGTKAAWPSRNSATKTRVKHNAAWGGPGKAPSYIPEVAKVNFGHSHVRCRLRS